MAVTEPSGWQRGVMNVPPDLNLCLFGGRGAGRTTSALFMSTEHCETYKGSAHVLFVRQTLRSLREVEDSFQMMLGTAYGNKMRVNRQEHVFSLPEGATIEFAPLSDVDDMAKLQGRSFSLIVVDEYGNFNPQQMKFVDMLRANLRAGPNVPTRMILLANPGGRGHGAIKARFIDPFTIRAKSRGPWFVHKLDDGKEWVWCPGNCKNNPNLPENYEQDLFAAAGKDKELFKAWAGGEWNIARGAMFADCLDEEVHRIRARDIPWLHDTQAYRRENGIPILCPPGSKDPSLYGYIAADWGQSSPSVAFAAWRLLSARGPYPKGSVILTDEVHSADPDDLSSGMNWSIGRFAEAMTVMADRNGVFQRGVLDDAKGLQPDDTLIASMEAYDFSFQRPQKQRRSGWAIMREMLVNAKERNGKPGLWIADRCTGFWATVPTLPRDPNNPEDVDTRTIDHWGDAARYAITHEPSVVGFKSASEAARRYGIAAPGAARRI